MDNVKEGKLKRWCYYLRPGLINKKMDEEEKREVFLLYKVHGNKWKMISKEFHGRSDNFIKNQFYSMIRLGFRRIYAFFGIARATTPLQLIKPKTLLEFVDICINTNGKSLKGINVIEQFIFRPKKEQSSFDLEILNAAKILLVYQAKFLIKFHKHENPDLITFLSNPDRMINNVIKNNYQLSENEETERLSLPAFKLLNQYEIPLSKIELENNNNSLKIDIKKLFFKWHSDMLKADPDLMLNALKQETLIKLFNLFEDTKKKILKRPEKLSQNEVLSISDFLNKFIASNQSIKETQENEYSSNQESQSINNFKG